jgi:hypothetical protein
MGCTINHECGCVPPTRKRFCSIRGDAVVGAIPVPGEEPELYFKKADPEMHVHDDFMDAATPAFLKLFNSRYQTMEPCPYYPNTRHARLRGVIGNGQTQKGTAE